MTSSSGTINNPIDLTKILPVVCGRTATVYVSSDPVMHRYPVLGAPVRLELAFASIGEQGVIVRMEDGDCGWAQKKEYNDLMDGLKRGYKIAGVMCRFEEPTRWSTGALRYDGAVEWWISDAKLNKWAGGKDSISGSGSVHER